MGAKYFAGVELRVIDRLSPVFKKLTHATKKLTSQLKPLEKQIDKTFGGKRLNTFIKGIDVINQKSRLMKYGLTAAFAGAVKVSAEFEEQMFRAGFILDSLNTSKFGEMSKSARELAATTIFTPGQIGEAEKELAKAGLTMQEITEQMPSFSRFAQLAEGDVVAMSRDFAAAYKAIGKKGESPIEFMETMAAAMNTSRLTGESLIEMFKFAGSELQFFEGPTKQIASAMATLADGMQDGSRAGTGVRAMFKQLANPTRESQKVLRKWVDTVKDVDPSINVKEIFGDTGYLKDFNLLVEFVSKANVNAQELDEVFGKIAGTAFATLLGRKGINGMGDALSDASTKITDIQEKFAGRGGLIKAFDDQFKNTTAGGLRVFISQIQELAIQLGESGLLGALGAVLKMFTPFFNWISKLSVGTKSFGLAFTGVGLTLLWLAGPVSGLLVLLKQFPIILTVIKAVVTPLTGAFGLFAIAIYSVVKNFDALYNAAVTTFDAIAYLFTPSFGGGFGKLSKDIDGAETSLNRFVNRFDELNETYRGFGIFDTQADRTMAMVAESESRHNADAFRLSVDEIKRGVSAKQFRDGEIVLVMKDNTTSKVLSGAEIESVKGNVRMEANTGAQ